MGKIAVTGGTFDFLHRGHKEFIKKILKVSDKLFLGLTSDSYIQKNKPNKGIASFASRKKELLDFLKDEGLENRVEVIKIENRLLQMTLLN